MPSVSRGCLSKELKRIAEPGNYNAHRLCQQLNIGLPTVETLPQNLWHICPRYIDNHQTLDGQLLLAHPMIFAAEITVELARYQVRVQWLRLDNAHSPHLLVTLECNQTARNRAIAEIHRYKLTPRQADVWLLHCSGFTYRDIATELFVSMNTVKRYMKDIYLKQKLHGV